MNSLIYYRDGPDGTLELVVAEGHDAKVYTLDDDTIASHVEALFKHIARYKLRKVSTARSPDTRGLEGDGNIIDMPSRTVR